MKTYKNTQAYVASLNAYNAVRRDNGNRRFDENKHMVMAGATSNHPFFQQNYYLRSRPTTKDTQSWGEAANGYDDSED